MDSLKSSEINLYLQNYAFISAEGNQNTISKSKLETLQGLKFNCLAMKCSEVHQHLTDARNKDCFSSAE